MIEGNRPFERFDLMSAVEDNSPVRLVCAHGVTDGRKFTGEGFVCADCQSEWYPLMQRDAFNANVRVSCPDCGERLVKLHGTFREPKTGRILWDSVMWSHDVCDSECDRRVFPVAGQESRSASWGVATLSDFANAGTEK